MEWFYFRRFLEGALMLKLRVLKTVRCLILLLNGLKRVNVLSSHLVTMVITSSDGPGLTKQQLNGEAICIRRRLRTMKRLRDKVNIIRMMLSTQACHQNYRGRDFMPLNARWIEQTRIRVNCQ